MSKKSPTSNTTPSRVRSNSAPLKIQKKINSDYAQLAGDYEKLGASLWRKPATKYVLGGIGAAVLVPLLFRTFKILPAIETALAGLSKKTEE